MPKSTPHFMERGVDTCRMIAFPVVASGQLPEPFQEWLGRLTIRCFSKSKKKNNFKGLRDVFGLGRPFLRISREFRRPPDVTCGASILIPRWRHRKWRQPGLGENFSNPIVVVVENGGPSTSNSHLGWPHSWETGSEVVEDGGWKRKIPLFPPTPKWGSKSFPYTTDILLKLGKGFFKSISSYRIAFKVALCIVF